MTPATVLLADDDNSLRTVLNKALAMQGYKVRATSNATTLWKWISEGEGDIVVTDVVMPDENAFELLPRIKTERPELPVIVMSAQNTVLTAITAQERGAYEYLPKPFDLNELTNLVQRALSPAKESEKVRVRLETTRSGENLPLIGRSQPMQEVYRIIARLTATDLTVMLTGESGTGKELVARALHDYGRRRGKSFVAINMAAIPRELIEAELFGQQGEASPAPGRKIGRFEQAHHGTLFLDEIGDMPMEAQTRLLRVLQDGEYTSVGGDNTVKTDVRIIAATNKDLQRQIENGQFREDLFFRLNVVPLRLPPLRERLEDIPDLVRHFLVRAEMENLPAKTINQDALDRLMLHDWPGNVRELENLIRRICAIHSGDVITAEIVTTELTAHLHSDSDSEEELETLSTSIAKHLDDYFLPSGEGEPPVDIYDKVLKELERPLIERCLRVTHGNQLKAAAMLGLNRNTLRKKIRDLDINVVRGQNLM